MHNVCIYEDHFITVFTGSDLFGNADSNSQVSLFLGFRDLSIASLNILAL